MPSPAQTSYPSVFLISSTTESSMPSIRSQVPVVRAWTREAFSAMNWKTTFLTEGMLSLSQ